MLLFSYFWNLHRSMLFISHSVYGCELMSSFGYILFMLFCLIFIHSIFSFDVFCDFFPHSGWHIFLIHSIILSKDRLNFNSYKEDSYFFLALTLDTSNTETLYSVKSPAYEIYATGRTHTSSHTCQRDSCIFWRSRGIFFLTNLEPRSHLYWSLLPYKMFCFLFRLNIKGGVFFVLIQHKYLLLGTMTGQP